MATRIERFVSCVVLCRSTAAELEPYVAELSAVLRSAVSDYEIVLVHDGAVDAAAAIDAILASQPYIRALQLTQNEGDSVAATAGLEAAIGDYVCVLDSENDPPELVPGAVATSIRGPDVVFGIDSNQTQRRALPRLLEQLFTWYARRYLKLDISSGMGSFRCLSRYAVNALTRLVQPHRYYRIWGDHVGLSTVRMSYQGRGQRKGRSLVESIDEALDIAISTSPHPLRIISGLGLLFALGNLGYILYILGIFLFKPDVATGWTTMSLQISALTLIVILLLVALSEYIGRSLERASPNPAYWVREERTSKRFGDATRVNIVESSVATDVDAPQR